MISEVYIFSIILFETIYDSLDSKELLRDINKANFGKIFEYFYNDLID